MKFMKEREALRDAQITLIMDKMGNTSGRNREDESSKPKQTHNDKPESSTKDLDPLQMGLFLLTSSGN